MHPDNLDMRPSRTWVPDTRGALGIPMVKPSTKASAEARATRIRLRSKKGRKS